MCGSCNTDLVAFMPRLPELGETVNGSAFQVFFGGKGANQCVAAAKLATTESSATNSVAMVGALGDDGFGRDYMAHLRTVGIATTHVAVHANTPSGVAPIWVDGHGSNSIVVVPGANGKITEEHVCTALADPAVASAGMLLCQLEIPTAANIAALREGKKLGLITALTPAPVPEGGLADGLYAHTDILLPNAIEASKMVASAGIFDVRTHCASFHRLTRAVVSALILIEEKGVSAVVVTLGSKGSLIAGKDGNAGLSLAYIPAVPLAAEKVVDTTGAGDAFAGALAYFYTQLTKGSSSLSPAASSSSNAKGAVDIAALVRAGQRAAVVAADSVTKKGAQASYAGRAELPAGLFDYGPASHASSLLPQPIALPLPDTSERAANASVLPSATWSIDQHAYEGHAWPFAVSQAYDAAVAAALPEGLRVWGEAHD